MLGSTTTLSRNDSDSARTTSTPNSALTSVADPTAVTVRPSVSISSATERIAAPRSPRSASDRTGTSSRTLRYSPSRRSITRAASSGAASNSASYTAATFRSETADDSRTDRWNRRASTIVARERASSARTYTVAVAVAGPVSSSLSSSPSP